MTNFYEIFEKYKIFLVGCAIYLHFDSSPETNRWKVGQRLLLKLMEVVVVEKI